MEAFSQLLALCAGNSPVPGDFPAQRPVTRSVDVFFDLRLNKRISKQLWSWWFDTASCPLWRHCNACLSSVWFYTGIYCYTIQAHYLMDCKWGMRHSLWLVGFLACVIGSSKYKLRGSYRFSAFRVRCNALWIRVSGGNSHCFSVVTGSPLHSLKATQITWGPFTKMV